MAIGRSALTAACWLLSAVLTLPGFAVRAQSGPVGSVNDYPTEARAEYVFACTNTNGRTQDALRRCSCAIDVIAAAVPFSEYEKAETVLRMRHLGGGYLAQEFRIPLSNAIVQQLEQAQAEADVSCF
jgi:hypothetical protein